MNRDREFLEHILESILLIEEYTKGITKEKFLGSNALQDMVLRRLEIIGEAAKNLRPEFKKNHDFIEWKKIAGLRDVIIHNYFGVDLDLTWEIIEKNLIKLKNDITAIIREL